MKFFIITILIGIFNFSFAQMVTVVGNVYSPMDSCYLGFATVYFDNENGTICDSLGAFSLTVDKKVLKKILKIGFVGFRELNIKNLPEYLDTIVLGTMPLFYGNKGVPMNDFFCKWYDFKCRRKAKQFMKNIENENKEYVMKINSYIDDFTILLFDNRHKMSYNDNYYNLKVFLDLKNH